MNINKYLPRWIYLLSNRGLLVSLVLTLVFAISACIESEKKQPTPAKTTVKYIPTPEFNSDSAYSYIQKQVDFGPRVPNTETHTACASYLAEKLRAYGAELIVQEATVKAFDNTPLKIKNIIAQFNESNPNRILLFAHWDTRPFADYCEEPERRDEPILGANDGASGVGVLLEIARQIYKTTPNIGVDIILFDAEDYGQPEHHNLSYKKDTWCLGTQYWAKNLHNPQYYARYGILLDMVGAKNATFTREGISMFYASSIVDKVWNIAAKLGYSNYFSFEKTQQITDDHLYVNQLANIPSINIIQHDNTTETNFGAYWHTHNDNMDIIDKNTLKAVGQTVLEVVYTEK